MSPNSNSAPPVECALAHTEWKMRAGFGLALLCLCVIGAVSYRSVAQLDGALRLVTQTYVLQQSLSSLAAQLSDGEHAVRGYIITADESYLGSYRQATAGANRQLADLHSMALGTTMQSRIEALTPLVAQQIARMEDTIEVRRDDGFESARQFIGRAPGEELHDSIDKLVDGIQLAASEALTRPQQSGWRHHQGTYVTLLSCSALACAIVGLALIGLRRDLENRAFLDRINSKVRLRLEALVTQQTQRYDALQRAYDDLRLTQQVVMDQERPRALGQLASGIAHDINNSLSSVTLYIESLLEDEPTLTPRARRHVETIQRANNDVARTVGRMHELSHRRIPAADLTPVDLNEIVRQVVGLTRARWSDRAHQRGVVIDVITELASDLPMILGVANELRDALVNLIFNAIDSMPQGGPLTLRTSLSSLPAGAGGPAVQLAGLEVIDAGTGMDEETRRRCLEPFFTTKGAGGTGLGLAMVYGTMQRHGSDVIIDSAPGRGTTMRFGFPVPSAHAIDLVTPDPVALSPLHILLVDDDPLVSAAVCEKLEMDGHRVVEADGGRAGIDVFLAARDAGDSFQVVITDLGMPAVDGREVAAAIKSTQPESFVVMLTGLNPRLTGVPDDIAGVDFVLRKPPSGRELRAALAHCAMPSTSYPLRNSAP